MRSLLIYWIFLTMSNKKQQELIKRLATSSDKRKILKMIQDEEITLQDIVSTIKSQEPSVTQHLRQDTIESIQPKDNDVLDLAPPPRVKRKYVFHKKPSQYDSSKIRQPR